MLPQLQQELPAVANRRDVEWSSATRIGFRFAFSYFFLYIAPGAVGSLGVGEHPGSYRGFFSGLWHQIVPWVGTSLLGLRGSLKEIPNGSGDQLYDYVLILCIFVTALLVTTTWSVLDRKRKNYRAALSVVAFVRTSESCRNNDDLWGRASYCRCNSPIPLGRLVDPTRSSVPMGLLWSFMGYSRAYSFFGGAGEMLGGILLIVPRIQHFRRSGQPRSAVERSNAEFLLRRTQKDTSPSISF